jgi:hypothetical protein
MTTEFECKAIIKETPHAEVLTGYPGHFGDRGHVPIDNFDAASGVKALAHHSFCSAFRLTKVFEIAVTPPDGSARMNFYQEKKDDKLYIFADRLTDKMELETNPALKSEWDRVKYCLPQWIGMPLYIDNQNAVQHVASEEYRHAVLLRRDGTELWRAPKPGTP